RIRACVVCFLILISARAGNGQSLSVRLEGNQLRFLVSDVRFIVGDALQQLHNGATVTYVFEAVVKPGNESPASVTVPHRFVVSFDRWEETCACTGIEPLTRSISPVVPSAAENCCLVSIFVRLDNIAQTTPFWITLEYHAEPEETGTSADTDSTLTRLVN